MAAAPTSVVWSGLTIGSGTRYRIASIEGWEDLPDVSYDQTRRARAHGTFAGPGYSDERTVTVEGWCWTEVDRDTLLRALRAVMVPAEDVADLAVTMAGLTLHAGAQPVTFRAIAERGTWGSGRFGWLAVWRCPDPIRYSSDRTASTGLPVDAGGLDYGAADGSTGVSYGASDGSTGLDYGPPTTDGRVPVTNDGDADVGVLVKVTGPLDSGCVITVLETGQELRYTAAIPAGQTIAIDTAEGTVVVDGSSDADRRRNLTVKGGWPLVPAGQTRTMQLASLGGFDAAAALTVTAADGYW